MNSLARVSQVLLVTGIIGLFATVSLYTVTQMQLQSWISTEGEVVSLLESNDSDGESYAPVIQYQDKNGNSYRFESSHYSSAIYYPVGAGVTMLYNPSKPNEAQVNDFWYLYIWTILCGGFTLSSFISTLVLPHMLRKKENVGGEAS